MLLVKWGITLGGYNITEIISTEGPDVGNGDAVVLVAAVGIRLWQHWY